MRGGAGTHPPEPADRSRAGALHLQVRVGAPDEESGERRITVHSRAEHAPDDLAWTLHADGLLGAAPEETPAGTDGLAVWPPADAEEAPLDGLYDGLAAGGLFYGPLFRGLRRVWRRGDEVFAEVAPDAEAVVGGEFALHPALFDSALHATGFGAFVADPTVGWLPFSWQDVVLTAAGATALRVRLAPAGSNTMALEVADGEGRPVATVGSLALRPLAASGIDRSGAEEAHFRVAWTALKELRRPGRARAATPSAGARDRRHCGSFSRRGTSSRRRWRSCAPPWLATATATANRTRNPAGSATWPDASSAPYSSGSPTTAPPEPTWPSSPRTR
ncbi:polyketide synthase dehydratase domain-containing protein [Actinomadura keratinilytica]